MDKIKNLKLSKRVLLGMITLASSLTFGSFDTIEVEAGGVVQEEVKSVNDYISYYSNVFNLKHSVIFDYFKEKTRNFTAYEWEHYNYINGKKYDNQELAVLLTIRDIYYHPEKHGYKIEDIKSSYKHTDVLEIEELIEKYSDLFGINKKIPLTICYCECGVRPSSYLFTNHNNPGGMVGKKFENKEIGVIYFVTLLKNTYKCNMESDINFFREINDTYGSGSEHWIVMTNSVYNNLEKDYYYHYPEHYEKDDKQAKMLTK